MIPGPTLVIKAPGCKNLLKTCTLISGNTFDATYWTDGKIEAPMLPDQPLLRKSPSEDVLFWEKDCETIGQVHFGNRRNEHPEWNDLEFAEEPTEGDYLKAIANGFGTTRRNLKYLRVRCWWRGNDSIRRRKKTENSPDLHNMEALAQLLSDDNAKERLMKAEVLRELSRFEEAIALLEHPFPKNYERAVTRITTLAQTKKNRVAKL